MRATRIGAKWYVYSEGYFNKYIFPRLDVTCWLWKSQAPRRGPWCLACKTSKAVAAAVEMLALGNLKMGLPPDWSRRYWEHVDFSAGGPAFTGYECRRRTRSGWIGSFAGVQAGTAKAHFSQRTREMGHSDSRCDCERRASGLLRRYVEGCHDIGAICHSDRVSGA